MSSFALTWASRNISHTTIGVAVFHFNLNRSLAMSNFALTWASRNISHTTIGVAAVHFRNPDSKKPDTFVSGFSKEKFSNVLLSHGNSHTTIGATAFHFWVRNGVRWGHSAIVAKQKRDNLEIWYKLFKKMSSNTSTCLLFLMSNLIYKTTWVLYG